MPIEPETLRLSGRLQSIEVLVEIGDPFLGIEAHQFFEVSHRAYPCLSDCVPAMPFVHEGA